MKLMQTSSTKKRNYFIFSLFLFWMTLLCQAASQQPLPVDKAFRFSATVKNPETITVRWDIAPRYHLYKERFSYKIITPKKAAIGSIVLPAGTPTEDQILGKYEIYSHDASFDISIQHAEGKPVTLWVCYQGCSDDNFCYPPETKQITLNLSNQGETTQGSTVSKGLSPPPLKISEQDKITTLLSEKSLWIILVSFLGFGLLLSFTPCVLPMIPILSGIIIGHGKQISTIKAFMLSLTYVLAMSLTYAAIGVLTGFAGESLQTAFQQPWVIVLFCVVFVLLALSLFGFYDLQLPERFQQKINHASNKQKSGTYIGVGIMGCLSTLIVSPCVTAPLIGALAYIGKTGDALLGGSALFVMGMGMGIPLLIIGTSSGKLLPKTGSWMNAVKALFGVLLLAMAIFMLSRIIPEPVTLVLWAGLLIISSIYLGILNADITNGWGKFKKGLGLVIAIYGIILMVGASMGNDDPLRPLGHSALSTSDLKTTNLAKKPLFTLIKNNDDFDNALADAVKNKKIAMLDFYANWCIACKEMEKKTFSNPEVQALLKNMVVLQADVTANDVEDKTLLQRLGVIAPPTILFFDSKGTEITSSRIVGEMDAKEFKKHLENLK